MLTTSRLAAKNIWTMTNLLKVLGLTLLLIALLSVNYSSLTFSTALLSTPIQLVLVAFIDTLLLSYFVLSSQWTGWKEWVAVFSFLYGVNYVLTAIESLYLTSLLTAGVVVSLFVNGAIVSAIFAVALVRVLGRSGMQSDMMTQGRLAMNVKEWVWKIIVAGVAYLFLFIVVGFAVYRPIAMLLNPVAFAQEQGAIAPSAALVLPVETFRGMLWALLAVPAIIAIPFSWRKTAVIIGLLFALIQSGNIFLTTVITPGLQIAHFAELFVENLIFGIIVVWILNVHSRLPRGKGP
jgi:hypothetical protein